MFRYFQNQQHAYLKTNTYFCISCLSLFTLLRSTLMLQRYKNVQIESNTGKYICLHLVATRPLYTT